MEQKIVLALNNFHEIITEKEDFYKIKTEFEKKLKIFLFRYRMESQKII